MNIVHKKAAYHPHKHRFFLRLFYVLSTSFLRNWYYEAIENAYNAYFVNIDDSYFSTE